MGALMVFDLQPTAPLPTCRALYKQRSTEKQRLVGEREENKTKTGEEKPEKKPAYP
jgi:hypothetical protein